ncbi:MAG TPA: glycosyltransferase family 2 protein [bacterium]|nr:glycosyltransferase family 2 protein [bacterium]
MPRIAVVICHHNRPGVLGPLLDSLRAQTAAGELAIFLVDNGSTDGSAAEAVAYPEVTVLATGANRGGTGGFNFGLAEVQRRGGWDAVLLLDNDVTLAPGAVAAMQEVLDTRPRAGMVTGTVYFAHERELIQETGALLIPATGDLLPRFHRRYDDGSYVDTVAVDYAGACLLMVRGATLAQIGLMDDSYFLYWDDIDWCCRARAAGWDVIAAPAAKCWHRGGLNVRRTTGYHYYKLRNRLRFWKRWATAEEWPGIVAAIGREVATMRAVAAWQQRPALAATLLDALRDAAGGVTGMAPAGRIRELAPGPGRPALSGPVAVFDWDADEEIRYQTLFRVTELLRQWLPDAAINLVAVQPPEYELYLLLRQRNITVTMSGEVAANTIIAPCEHAWLQRDNPCAAALPPELVWWCDRHSNVVSGSQPCITADGDSELAGVLV